MSLKSKKGVSALIASVLLIAFTVSVSMIVMGWFSTFTRTATANISATTTEAIGCNAASINIERVYVSGDGSNCTAVKVIVKNTGFKSFTTVNAMFLNSTGGSCSTSSGSALAKGSATTLSLTCANKNVTTCTGTSPVSFSRVVVTTECGGVDDEATLSSDVTCNC